MKIYLFLSLFISSFRNQKVSGSEFLCFTSKSVEVWPNLPAPLWNLLILF